MRKLSVIIALALCFCFVFSVVGYGADFQKTKAQTQTDDVESLKKQLEELQEAYDALLADYEALKAQLGDKPNEADYDIDYSAKDVVVLIQQALNDAGYQCGTPDGNAGSQTSAAIRNLQTDKGLAVTGTINFELINALGKLDEAQSITITAREAAEAAEKEAQERIGYETGITYNQLARTPDEYEGKLVKFYGEVIQMIYDPEITEMRLAVNGNYDTILYCGYDPSIVSSRVLEDDYITIYGQSIGLISYESTMGGQITIPAVWVEKIDQ